MIKEVRTESYLNLVFSPAIHGHALDFGDVPIEDELVNGVGGGWGEYNSTDVPNFRWIAAHLTQMKMPKLHEAQRGLRDWQSAHTCERSWGFLVYTIIM